MRLIALEVCAGVAALLFITALVAIAAHRVHRSDGPGRGTALAEFVWAVVPWIMVVAAALPAVRLIVAKH
jgi:heme/copper-type cytochrome/quinol oxidase subunit 2